jgi:hypothetical protein
VRFSDSTMYRSWCGCGGSPRVRGPSKRGHCHRMHLGRSDSVTPTRAATWPATTQLASALQPGNRRADVVAQQHGEAHLSQGVKSVCPESARNASIASNCAFLPASASNEKESRAPTGYLENEANYSRTVRFYRSGVQSKPAEIASSPHRLSAPA